MRSTRQRSGFVKVTAIVLALLMLGSVVTLVFMSLAAGF